MQVPMVPISATLSGSTSRAAHNTIHAVGSGKKVKATLIYNRYKTKISS